KLARRSRGALSPRSGWPFNAYTPGRYWACLLHDTASPAEAPNEAALTPPCTRTLEECANLGWEAKAAPSAAPAGVVHRGCPRKKAVRRPRLRRTARPKESPRPALGALPGRGARVADEERARRGRSCDRGSGEQSLGADRVARHFPDSSYEQVTETIPCSN
ncbi:hypothetical protein V5799_031682, partial [Amblyomma americanum]